MTADDVRARFEAWFAREYPNTQELAERGNSRAVVDKSFASTGYRAAHADLSGEVRELVEDWRTAADAHAEIGYPACADVGRRCADELEAALAKFTQEKP